MDKIIIKDKKIIEFYNKYKNIDIEKVNLKIIEMYEEIIKTLSGEMKDHVTSEILTKIKIQEIELESFKNELKTEMSSIKTINALTNTNIVNDLSTIKETINKLNTEITNNIISKFYDIKNVYKEDLKMLLDKNGNENMIKIIEKIEK